MAGTLRCSSSPAVLVLGCCACADRLPSPNLAGGNGGQPARPTNGAAKAVRHVSGRLDRDDHRRHSPADACLRCAALAQQATTADIDKMMAVIEAQQKQIDAMRAELNAMKAQRASAPAAAAAAPTAITAAARQRLPEREDARPAIRRRLPASERRCRGWNDMARSRLARLRNVSPHPCHQQFIEDPEQDRPEEEPDQAV